MPEYGVPLKAASEILSFEEIIQVVKLGLSLGINKIKLTGGEPLLRKDLPHLIHLLSSLSGLKDLSLTTNGVLLKEYVFALKSAGLKRINISLDTLDSQKFKAISRQGNLKAVLEGLDTARREGFFIKLNVVVLRGLNDDEILNFVKFSQEKQIIVRFIELMPIGVNNIGYQDLYISCAEIKERLKVFWQLQSIGERFGNGPAEYYRLKGTPIIVGFISPLSNKFCSTCSRLRLTADGLLIPCLADKQGIDLKKPLRQNHLNEVLNLLKKAVFLKPKGHKLNLSSYRECLMSKIGG